MPRTLLILILGLLLCHGGTAQLTNEEKLKILIKHRLARQNVNPPAANMLYMRLCPNLSTMAQAFTDRCQMDARPGAGYELLGFNRAWSTERDVDGLMDSWTRNPQSGNYTQMVWWETRRVGCGITLCPGLASVRRTYMLVCLYRPQGNIRGEKPYIEGSSCSKCHPQWNQYCRHNQCIRPPPSRPTREGPLTDEEKQEILKWHIEGRANVQPSAANMQILKIAPDLERLAERWAKRCEWRHPERDDTVYKGTGQNIAYHSWRQLKEMVDGWYDEGKEYSFSSNTCSPKIKTCLHYTQMVWANTTEIGCAIEFCKNSVLPGKDVQFLVCQYRAPGNYPGVKPYVPGARCSKCKSDQNCVQNQCE